MTTRIAVTFAAVAGLAALLYAGAGQWPGETIRLLGDCERLVDGLTVQPVAAWTSLAFLPAGIWVAGHPGHRPTAAIVFAAGLVAVGLGSFAGHASGTTWGRELDSLAIKVMLVPFIAYPLLRDRVAVFVQASAAGAITVIAIEIAFPATGRPLLALMVILLAAVLVLKHDAVALAPAFAVLALGVGAWWLGRTGGALCEPGSLLQVHGMWHILAAGGFTLLYRAIHDH